MWLSGDTRLMSSEPIPFSSSAVVYDVLIILSSVRAMALVQQYNLKHNNCYLRKIFGKTEVNRKLSGSFRRRLEEA